MSWSLISVGPGCVPLTTRVQSSQNKSAPESQDLVKSLQGFVCRAAPVGSLLMLIRELGFF